MTTDDVLHRIHPTLGYDIRETHDATSHRLAIAIRQDSTGLAHNIACRAAANMMEAVIGSDGFETTVRVTRDGDTTAWLVTLEIGGLLGARDREAIANALRDPFANAVRMAERGMS